MGPSILPQPFEIRILKLCFSHMRLAQAPGRRDRNKKQLQVSGGWWERWGRRQCSVWVQDQGLRHCDSVISSSSDTVWVSHLQSHYYVLVIYIVIYTCVYIHTHIVYVFTVYHIYVYIHIQMIHLLSNFQEGLWNLQLYVLCNKAAMYRLENVKYLVW